MMAVNVCGSLRMGHVRARMPLLAIRRRRIAARGRERTVGLGCQSKERGYSFRCLAGVDWLVAPPKVYSELKSGHFACFSNISGFLKDLNHDLATGAAAQAARSGKLPPGAFGGAIWYIPSMVVIWQCPSKYAKVHSGDLYTWSISYTAKYSFWIAANSQSLSARIRAVFGPFARQTKKYPEALSTSA